MSPEPEGNVTLDLRHVVACVEHLCEHHYDPDPVEFRSQVEKLMKDIVDRETNLHPGHSCDICEALREVARRLRESLNPKGT